MKRFTLFFLFLMLIGCAPLNDAPPSPVATAVSAAPTLTATPVLATPLATDVAPPLATAVPTLLPAPTQTRAVPPTVTPAPTTFCPDLSRPALVVATADGLLLTHPLTGASCPLPVSASGPMQVREDGLYLLDGAKTAVIRHTPSGHTTPLPFTQAPAGSLINSFVLSPDGSRIAWSTLHRESDGSTHTHLIIANLNGEDRVEFPEIALPNGRFVKLVQIGYDNQQLFFAYQSAQTEGLNGRYDSLYTTCCGGYPQKLFDCADLDLSFCIGDITPDGQQIAYISHQAIITANADGRTRATIPVPEGLIRYPTFNLAGDLAFYASPVDDPATAILFRSSSPHDEPAQSVTLGVEPIPLLQWQGSEYLTVGRWNEAGQLAHALIALADGTTIPLLGEPVALLAPFKVPTPSQTELSPNGRWQVRFGQSAPVAVSGNELETFPSGLKYAVFLEVAEVDGSLRHVIVDEWRGAGLGQEWPIPYRWSADGQSLYITDTAAVDGCGMFITGTHLDKVDLATGAVTQLLPPFHTLNFALSPDEQGLALISRSPEGAQLLLRNVVSGDEQAVLLNAAPDAQAGDLVWSPDSHGLIVTLVHAPCSEQTRYSLLHFSRATNALTPLVSAEPAPTRVEAWPNPSRVQLTNASGESWLVDVALSD